MYKRFPIPAEVIKQDIKKIKFFLAKTRYVIKTQRETHSLLEEQIKKRSNSDKKSTLMQTCLLLSRAPNLIDAMKLTLESMIHNTKKELSKAHLTQNQANNYTKDLLTLEKKYHKLANK